MRILSKYLMLAFVLGAAGCSHHKQSFSAGKTSSQNEKGGVTGEFVWVKNKGKSVDILLNLSSEYKYAVDFDPKGVQVYFNGTKGTFHKVNSSGRLGPNGSDEFLVVFTFNPPVDSTGEAKLVIPAFHKEVGEGETGKNLPPLKISATIER